MGLFRWILLAVGIIFIVLVYLFGHKRRQRKREQDEVSEEDLPEFNARNWDDLDEGVGPVRVISGDGSAVDVHTNHDSSIRTESSAMDHLPTDIIVLFILPRLNNKFSGAQINSSVQAMGLKFGKMNIYHYLKGERTVFSLANMHEPGSFDPDTIHDLRSSGLTIFMQVSISVEVDALDDLTEMLQRSYQIAGLIGGRLCNHRRQPLTEQDAENYRSHVEALRKQDN